jgi:hypothetical protein
MNKILLTSMPMIVMAEHVSDAEQTYFSLTWTFFSVMLFIYLLLIVASVPYVRPRFPFGLIILSIFFPPLFFFFLFYVFFLYLFVAPVVIVQQEQEMTQSQSRTTSRSRSQIRNNVV